MADPLRPATVDELCGIVSAAARDGAKLRLRGGGSKDEVGAPAPDAQAVDMGGFAGVIDYDPPELVLTVGAGTPLAEVRALVAAEGQMLAFDPSDHGGSTIGGTMAAGVAGPLRLTQGGARDHLLGFEAVSGRGERFVAGAKVVKNVTGYDLPKVVCGSWGRLVALTQLTLKVLPRPRTSKTLLLRGLGPAAAVGAMACALGSSAGVSAAAHLPDWSGGPATALRLDGFPESIRARAEAIGRLLEDIAAPEPLDDEAGAALWHAVRYVRPLPADMPLWRIIAAPSRAPALLEALAGAAWLLDWAGGLVWIAFDGDSALVRRAAEQAGGHAMLVRAPEEMRTAVPALHPPAPALAALEARVRRAFDPAGVFETGRF